MKRIVLAVAGLLVACGGSSTQNANYKQEQTPVTPTGTIVGRVIDMSTYAPLEGVSVKVLGSDSAALTSNADGVFVLKDAVVNSSYMFVMDKQGYLRQTTNAQIQGTTGNSPLAGSVTSFNAQLYKADGEVRGNVFLPDGKPAANATVVIDNRNSGAGDSVVTTTTDTAGFFKLTGIGSAPRGLNTTVYALWYDENNDQLADYGTAQTQVAVHPGVIERVFISYTSLGQRVIASNIMDAELAPSDDMQFTLALPCLDSNLNQNAYRAFVLTDTTRGAQVAVEATWSSAVQVAVHPTIPLREGDLYNIALSLTNASAGNSNANPNFSTSFNFQVRSPNISAITDQVANFSVTNTNLTATRGPRQFDFDSNSFKLVWDAVPNAVSYAVYAKDTLYNPDWVQVTTVTSQNYPRYTTTVGLGGAFDPNGTGRPLALGNKVTFTVVPMDVYGNMSPLNSAPTQQVSDNVPPTAATMVLQSPVAGTLDAANDEATPLLIVLRLTYSEPMDSATAPQFTTTAGNVTAAFVWDNYAASSGLMTITVPPGVDGTGPFIIRGGKDMGGNLLLNNDFNGGLSGRKELGTNWNFEDASGTCALTGWNGSSTGGGTNPVTVQGSSSRGRCAAVVGTLPGSNPTTGISRLSQDITLPSLTNTAGWSLDARINTRMVFQPSSGGPVPGGVAQRCGLADTTNNFLSIMRQGSSLNETSYVLATTSASALANTTVRMLCEVNNPSATIPSNAALYVDEFSIATFKTGAGWFQ